MPKTKIDIITCFESNEERLNYIYDACLSRNCEVKAVSSDFSHIRKQKRTDFSERITYLETRPYSRNMSVRRMLSHYKFAESVFAFVENDKPDLIWLIAPANSLIMRANQYKAKHPEVKLIIDIIDMWPESLPLNADKNLFPFSLWRNIRSKNISCADHLVTECDYYHEILAKEYDGPITTIYWARDNSDVVNNPKFDDDLNLIYIGSINNIIDTKKIRDIVSKCNKKIKFHIIGEGEKTDRFINELSGICEVKYYGAVREENRKCEIFNKCHAGINIYHDNLYIGFTTKCIDYFEHGLPIINNIKGDTWKMVMDNDAGINISDKIEIDWDLLVKQRSNFQQIVELYNKNFTKDVFMNKCLKVIDEVMK